MNWFLLAPLLNLIVLLLLIRRMGRHKRFQEHMVRSRQHSNRAFEAFGKGDQAKGEVFLAASMEELDRASYYAECSRSGLPRRRCGCGRPSVFAVTLSKGSDGIVDRVERCETCVLEPETTEALWSLGIQVDQSVTE